MYECQQKSATTWGSHLYMLLPALTYSAGAILEIGVEHNSSILMNAFSLYAAQASFEMPCYAGNVNAMEGHRNLPRLMSSNESSSRIFYNPMK